MPENFEFHKETVKYLELIISTEGISINENIVDTISDQSKKTNRKNGRLNNLFDV